MNTQIESYKEQILENVQTLEKLCNEYWLVAKDAPEDMQLFELGSKDIYDGAFQSVFEVFHEATNQ